MRLMLAAAAAFLATPTATTAAPRDGVVIVTEMSLDGFNPAPQSVVNAATLALEEARGRACGGNLEVTLRSNSYSSPTGGWSPMRAAANARADVADSDVVAVIGPFNSGAAMAMIPIANEAHLQL